MLRRGTIAVFAALAFAASTADAAQAPLPNLLARALAVPHVSSARSGALAVDLTTGTPIFSQNEQLPLAPASNEKLALTYAVLVELGPAFRIETDVLGEGDQQGPVWRGDLVLKGYGDPTLTRRGLARLAAAVRRLGITRVTGSVLGDESYFDTLRVAPGWKASFYMDESPPLSALSVDRGHYHGVVSRYPASAAAALFVEALHRAGVHVAGVSGTLEDRMRHSPAAGVVAAKTGTTNVASALAGYVRGRYAFAVIQNGHPVPFWWARMAQDRFATLLATQ